MRSSTGSARPHTPEPIGLQRLGEGGHCLRRALFAEPFGGPNPVYDVVRLAPFLYELLSALLEVHGLQDTIARIEAYGHHVEIVAQLERHGAQGFFETAQFQGAEHRAFVVDECEDDRLAVEVVAKLDGFVRFISELGVERKHLAKPLIEADVVQFAR